MSKNRKSFVVWPEALRTEILKVQSYTFLSDQRAPQVKPRTRNSSPRGPGTPTKPSCARSSAFFSRSSEFFSLKACRMWLVMLCHCSPCGTTCCYGCQCDSVTVWALVLYWPTTELLAWTWVKLRVSTCYWYDSGHVRWRSSNHSPKSRNSIPRKQTTGKTSKAV